MTKRSRLIVLLLLPGLCAAFLVGFILYVAGERQNTKRQLKSKKTPLKEIVENLTVQEA